MNQDLEKLIAEALTNKSLLVVEDTSSSRMLVAGLLRGLGATRVVAAVDGVDALAKIQAQHLVPDVVLCDWVMPNMDGLELLTRLKADYPAVKFIMMTVKTEAEAVILARKHGVDGYVAKPFSRESITAALAKVLGIAVG
ncbi:response regulator [Magnetospirillum sulfuroxidans]|uniref:Response regulator n=1 Tax=Magnetospirillum sulfuroxidans TaxID=611300 RepID=A0ABS5IG26_9PROT|nr:response regulator [Magnetospirillum sulfuroxidans]MBR9973370.1 response regulator [Magnetospirillum sulfuroxidans]